jgi:hypothetical protein
MRKHVEESQLEHATLIASHTAQIAAESAENSGAMARRILELTRKNEGLELACARLLRDNRIQAGVLLRDKEEMQRLQRQVTDLFQDTVTSLTNLGDRLLTCEEHKDEGSTQMKLCWLIEHWPTTAVEELKRRKSLSSSDTQVGPHRFKLELQLASYGTVGIFVVLAPSPSDLYPLDLGGTEFPYDEHMIKLSKLTQKLKNMTTADFFERDNTREIIKWCVTVFVKEMHRGEIQVPMLID